jgi:hypothetical protein
LKHGVFKAAGVPIGKARSSRFRRAVETARLIGGREAQALLAVTEGGLVVSPNENSRRAKAGDHDFRRDERCRSSSQIRSHLT